MTMPNAVLMLAHCRRQWASIRTVLRQRLVSVASTINHHIFLNYYSLLFFRNCIYIYKTSFQTAMVSLHYYTYEQVSLRIESPRGAVVNYCIVM